MSNLDLEEVSHLGISFGTVNPQSLGKVWGFPTFNKLVELKGKNFPNSSPPFGFFGKKARGLTRGRKIKVPSTEILFRGQGFENRFLFPQKKNPNRNFGKFYPPPKKKGGGFFPGGKKKGKDLLGANTKTGGGQKKTWVVKETPSGCVKSSLLF